MLFVRVHEALSFLFLRHPCQSINDPTKATFSIGLVEREGVHNCVSFQTISCFFFTFTPHNTNLSSLLPKVLCLFLLRCLFTNTWLPSYQEFKQFSQVILICRESFIYCEFLAFGFVEHCWLAGRHTLCTFDNIALHFVTMQRFNTLPLELRRKIWKAASFIPRNIDVRITNIYMREGATPDECLDYESISHRMVSGRLCLLSSMSVTNLEKRLWDTTFWDSKRQEIAANFLSPPSLKFI